MAGGAVTPNATVFSGLHHSSVYSNAGGGKRHSQAYDAGGAV